LIVMALLAACGGDSAAQPDAGTGGDGGGSGDTWAPLPNVSTGAIQETAVVAVGTDVYVIGGFMGVTPQTQVLVFDTVQSSWRAVRPLPVEMHHANAAVVDGKIYVLGGMQLVGFNFVAIGNTYEYDPARDEWTAKAAMPAGAERGSAFVGVVDGKVYLAGGLVGGTAVDLVSSYDPVGDEWTHPLAPLPVARDHGVGAAIGANLFAIGGREGAITALVDRVDRYDPVGDEWTSRAPMITARGGTAAGVIDGRIIVVGGEGNTAVTSGVFPHTESYDPVADTWTSLAPMTTPRHGMGAAAVGGALYVPGGATTQGFGATDVSEVYYP
jgi:N-acetylneuraminic acid mutarotase